jgi:hypothetical protein
MNGNTFHRHDNEPHFWVGYLAGRIRDTLAAPENARSGMLRDALRNVLGSPVCTPELAAELGATDPKTRPVPDEPADWGALWRPCLNPECHMPLPRQSTRLYCDALCKKIAHEHMNDLIQSDEVPY